MYTKNKRETFHPAHRQGYEPFNAPFIFCLLLAINAALPSKGLAAIKVEPGTTVQVGEEVFFDGTGVTISGAELLPNGMIEGSYEWDFGDGYTLMKGYPYSWSDSGGTTVSHYFMRPGIYTATLNVTDINGKNKIETTIITVEGKYPKLPPRPVVERILELKFEDNLDDTSGNGLIAQWQNGTGSFAGGKEGQAVDLTNGAYIEVSDPNGILSGMDELTIFVWAKKKVTNIEGYLLDKNGAYNVELFDGWPSSIAGTIKTETSSKRVNYLNLQDDTMWHHYVITYNGSLAKLFIDGKERIEEGHAPSELTGKVKISADNLLIGKKFGGINVFNGYIDELKIYNKALTPKELFVGFEFWHADFHGHIAQYIYAQIPGEFTQDSTNKIKATVTRDTGFSKVLLNKNNLQLEEKFLLNNSELPAGNYTLTAQLLDATDKVLDEIKEKFEKPYDGIPVVGIDENNAIRINGELFFPVTPFGLNKDITKMGQWVPGNYINTLYNEGWYAEHNIDSWKDYLGQGLAHGWNVIGPGTWVGGIPHPYRRNADIGTLTDSITQTKDYSNLIMWHLGDEPDIGSEARHIPSPVLRSRTYKIHKLDPNHLVATNFAGRNWVSDSATRRSKYDFMNNARYFGGRGGFVADVLGFDYYPIEWAGPEGGNAKVWKLALALDRLREGSYNLVPYMSFVETANIKDDVGRSSEEMGTPPPTPEQLRMLTWLSVVHGVKGINWFHYFMPTPPENFAVMAEFTDHITQLTSIVLGPETDKTVTDTADENEAANRVDTMIRDDGEDIWLIAVRVTEADEPQDDNDLSVTFTVEGLTSDMAVIEPGEFGQSVVEYYGHPTEKRRIFSFTLSNTPIIPGTVQVAGQYTPGEGCIRIHLYDDGSGNLYGVPISWKFKDMEGKVNYETGEVYADFGEVKIDDEWDSKPILQGQDMVRATYRPVKSDRIITHTGNTFTDTFAPNAVHIYRISLSDQGTKHAPVLAPIDDKFVNEGQELSFGISATDRDLGDNLSFTLSNNPDFVSLTDNGDGTGSLDIAPGYVDSSSYPLVRITVTDDGIPNKFDYEDITITVNNINRAPVAVDDSATVAEDSGDNAIDVRKNDLDADDDTLTIIAVTQPSHGSVVITGGGTGLTYTPAANYNGSDSFTYTVSDGNGGTDTATVNMTITSVPDTPVLDAIGNKLVNENSQLTFTASASDTDVPGNTLTFSLINAPVGASIDPVTGYFTWIPTEVQGPGSYNDVTVRVTDNGVGSLYDQETITITVNETNVAPVLGPIDDQTIDVGSQLTFTANATDADVPANGLTFSLSNAPAGASIDPVSGKFTWTPTEAQGPDSYDVTVRVTDDGAGNLYDEESMTITIVPDETDPTVTNLSPAADSIQAPLNTLVILDITDSGDGVDANSVEIEVNGETVYSGNTTKHSSAYGDCYRIGTKANYKFIYQSEQNFEFGRPVSVTVNATDLKSNVMDEYSYSFKSEMRSFGRNKRVDPRDVKKGRPVTVRDSNGDIWAAWHAGVADSRDIYIGKLEDGAVNFDSSVQLTSDAAECNPVTATGSDGKLYVAWQDNRRGNWDIYISTSNDWSAEIRVTDSNDNQINPAIVVDSSLPNNAYIVWEDDRNGNQDIYVAKSSDGFATTTVSQITSDSSDQVEPAIAVDSGNTIYVVWTDTRNEGKKDIYGAASNDGPWTNVPVVTEEDGQSSPAIAAEADGSILHLVWVDDRIVDANDDIFYAKTDGGLPGSPLIGSSIIDDNTGADQISPVIITTGSTEGDDLKVFACWRDERNADADLYFAEISSEGDYGTNVFVGDEGTNSDQSEPAIGIDGHGHPYLVWTNERTDICYAGSTFIDPDALASENVSMSLGATVGTEPASISSIDDVSAEVPQGAYLCDVEVTISRIRNPHKTPSNNRTFLYEFGPSGTTFSDPVTITIPYNATSLVSSPSAYWYNPLTGLYSQEGITDVEVIQISSGLYALRFKTTHFSIFGGGGPFDDIFGGGGGGGGCSMSPNSQDSIAELLLPYIGLAVAMVVLKLRNRRKRKAHNITKSGC